MKVHKRLTALLMGVAAAIALLPVSSFAAGAIDPSHEVGLTISFQNGGTPLVGAKFDLFLVATVDQYGRLTKTADFTSFHVDIRGKNDEAWKTLASTLESYVLRDHITPADTGKTSSSGLLSFPTEGRSLTPGLYLVMGHRHTQNGYYYDAQPFMVMLPSVDKAINEWNYYVTANAKHDATRIPEGSNVPDTVTCKVLKVWEDDGYEEERPEEVVIQLLRDDDVYDTVKLSAETNWRHTWTGLDSRYKWTVVEKELDSYYVELTREGITFVVTNTYSVELPDEPTPITPDPELPDDPEPISPVDPDNEIIIDGEQTKPADSDTAAQSNPSGSKLPQTGQLWWPVPALISAGMLFIIIGLIRRRGIIDED